MICRLSGDAREGRESCHPPALHRLIAATCGAHYTRNHRDKARLDGHGLGQSAPRHQHQAEAGALREAERLAEVRPGVTFVVPEATKAMRTRRLDHYDLRTAPAPRGQLLEDQNLVDDIPF